MHRSETRTMLWIAAALHVDGLTTRVLLLLMVLAVNLENVYSARILLASPQLASHVLMQTPVGKQLVQQGHEVYIAIGSRYRDPESLEQMGLRTVTYHIPSDVPFGWSDDIAKLIAELVFSPDFHAFSFAKTISALVSQDCEFMLSDKKFVEEVQALKLDIALVDALVINPCVLLLPYNLNVRFVSLANFYLPWSIRMPALPSFLPISSPVVIDGKPTLWNSLINTVLYVGGHWMLPSAVWNNTLLDCYSSGHSTWNELILKSELFFVVDDHHLGLPFPVFPNIVPVPGITIQPTKPLPDKLAKLARESHNGIILVTFGSTAMYFPEPVIVKFLEAFSGVEQTVIAKLSVPEGVTVPGNVHVFQWLPQNDILGHQQTKLFVTHCGSNGQHEALYHGVPMLGFPLFADQPSNCEQARAKGFGLTMNIHDFSSEELFDSIQEMLSNKSYNDNIKRSSAILHDEPMLGPKKVAHWIEHVIKYGSAHLRSPALDLPLYRFLMFDVLAIIFVMIFVVTAIICVATIAVTRIIRRKLFCQPNLKKFQ